VTLAAIVEKETGCEEERPMIASVFLNRLERGMRLESDPTVIYGIKDFNGNLTRKDLTEHTPYNTYVIRGLPPGPIASPGLKAIKAVLYPAQTDYLYFVSRNDGSHYFSSSLSEHNRAVSIYQKRRRSGRSGIR
ncbi:MAG: endolytic transglycosylase MltG, partial [Thermodesulfobacteriota bacterium]|nr:endolytic transglycosylase MltG [Thermodesulfobacteriota bacterium]